MRRTALAQRPKKVVAQGASIPAPVGGWDAISPLSEMPPTNAVELVNFFPQAGYVELRRGHIAFADTGTADPVETVMGYQGLTPDDDRLFAISAGTIFDVTNMGGGDPVVTGLLGNRWQHINFTSQVGPVLWACNGLDEAQYYDGTSWSVANITGLDSRDMVQCVVYRGRIWTVLKNSTKAAYLALDAIQGAATEFEVGQNFRLGGHLAAIGTWSTDTVAGPDEFVAFISSYGEVAIYMITDPDNANGISFRGVAQVGSPLGRRCLTKAGADLIIISNDGVLPLSRAASYDKAAMIAAALSRNIQPVVAQATRAGKDLFGWQIIAYPRGTQAILNVPRIEGVDQEQFVMNTVTGAWCRYVGQRANCWEIWKDRPFFGGNDGVVYEADRSGLDADGSMHADMKTSFNYYGARGRLKRWTTVRPLINTDGRMQTGLALNVDFRDDGPSALTPPFDDGQQAHWNQFNWDQANWPIEQSYSTQWNAISGIGYCASIQVAIDVDRPTGATSLWDTAQWDTGLWDDRPVPESVLQINGFDVLFELGDYV